LKWTLLRRAVPGSDEPFLLSFVFLLQRPDASQTAGQRQWLAAWLVIIRLAEAEPGCESYT